jgi:uncharacterized protein DUF397
VPDRQWVKSSFSDAGGNNCVEVAAAGHGGVALRESDDPDHVVVASANALAALLASVKARRVG